MSFANLDMTLYISAFVTLFVIIDPIGLTPLFATLTKGMGPAQRRSVAMRSILVGFGLLALFGIAGEKVLTFVGISMPAFRIAGGILLFLIALEMLFERRAHRREEKVEELPDPSVFPLAMPLIAGPGALATMILLTGTPNIDALTLVGLHVVVAVVLAIVWLMFLSAGLLERLLGPTGIALVSRLLGMLLAALAVQFVLNGVAELGLLSV